jgi:alanine racemase
VQNVPLAEAGAVLTIDLDALAANWTLLANRVRPAHCAAVVKADAYGIGIERAVPALARAGCAVFFVAHFSEGRRVVQALGALVASSRIYVLNGLMSAPGGVTDFVRASLRPVLASAHEIALWRGLAPAGAPAPGLQIDTGMNRLGLDPREAAALFSDPDKHIPLSLVMSHFVASEVPYDPLNAGQTAAFESLLPLFPGVPKSIANSSGIFLPQSPQFDLVRPGYALYGGNPMPGALNPMQPVINLSARILQVHHVKAGGTVGYNSQWTAKRDTRLATVGVGYADGFPRLAGSTDTRREGAEAMLAGTRCRLVGRVSMDLTVIDITDAPDAAAKPGAMIELLNREITIDDLAYYVGNSGYTVLTGLGARYHRIYLGR